LGVAQIAIYQLSIPFIKAVFLLQYRRVFALPSIQRLCDVLLIFVALFGLTQFVVSVTFCIPIAFWWDKTIEGGRCINTLTWWHVGSIVNIITDVIIFVIPLALLHTLPLHKSQKFILGAIFGLGFL
jgi:hypothetical protein